MRVFQRWIFSGIVSATLSTVSIANAADPPKQQTQFPPNPLELRSPDPLLPGGLNRPLSQPERQTLRTALDQLNLAAAEKLRSGDVLGSFEIWNRELRLRRALGWLEEVQALGRVGDVAWRQNQPSEVRVITNRLATIQTQLQQAQVKNQIAPSDRARLLPALGIAYQQVRSPGQALSIYNQMLGEARARKDATTEVELLNTIGQLNLSWFDYPKAIATYTELLNLAKSRSDTPNIIANLIQLAYTHEQAKQPAQAVPYQQQLIEFYQQRQPEVVPALKIRLGDDYVASKQLDAAEKAYQEAFQLAQPLLQFAYASDALQKLGKLYRSNDRLDAALQVYQYLTTVQQQSYDTYGMMNAYDQIGQIQLQRKAYPAAADAFRQGLEVAKQINYRTDYFTEQLQKAQASQ